MPDKAMRISIADIRGLLLDACLACGASAATAKSLVDATISAACFGRRELGFPDFVSYLRSLRAGRINGNAAPRFETPLPAVIHGDADGGLAQLGFDLSYDDLVRRTRTAGVTVFTQRNSYTTGELGYYVRRLALEGLLAMAFTNGPALVAAREGGQPVYCTNPLAFGAPLPAPLSPLVIDQSTSATAFFNIVRAAEAGLPLEKDWAIDDTGAATTDPAKALLGALLPFGGYKGANLALMVELLAAGLSGAAWSLDAGDFRSGNRPPNAGLTILAIHPAAIDANFKERLGQQLERLQAKGVHIPGRRSAAARSEEDGTVDIDADALDAIESFVPPAGPRPKPPRPSSS